MKTLRSNDFFRLTVGERVPIHEHLYFIRQLVREALQQGVPLEQIHVEIATRYGYEPLKGFVEAIKDEEFVVGEVELS